MYDKRPWEKDYLREIELAEDARSSGNEGMARVCARRAAGIIIGEYFARQGVRGMGPSAYERIKQLRYVKGISNEVQEITDHLLQRVNLDHEMPSKSDLIAETRQLAKELL